MDLVWYISIILISFHIGMKYAGRESEKERHYKEVKNIRWWKEVELGRKFRTYLVTVCSKPSQVCDRHSSDHGYELYGYDSRYDSTDFRVSIKFGYDNPIRVGLGHMKTYKEYHFKDDEAGIQKAFELLANHFQKHPVGPAM